jgi:hypothetical protein
LEYAPTMEHINKAKVVGFKEFFDTFDINDLFFEDVDENYLNGTCSSEVVNGNLCSNDKFHTSNTPPSIVFSYERKICFKPR